ncbi:MAG: hypothetical protein ACREOK_06785, partial [Gemmatimonadaceae bacterium]
ILHYVEPGLFETSHQYPVGAMPLVSGRTYAWRVQALDGTGKPIASNQGRSEIWTFVYREPESEAQRTVARVEVTASRDTLRFSGDTVRYAAQAYDADNVEILGKMVQWRALDTSIVRVDSAGVVTAAKLGQTQVLAAIDGVVDSAAAIMASRRVAVRFEMYDASAAEPSLLEVLKSGSFDDVVPRLNAMLEAGELRIPIPRLPAFDGAAAPGDDGETDAGRSTGGPSPPPESLGRARSARERACDGLSADASVHLDRTRAVWSLMLEATSDVLHCLVPKPEVQTRQVVQQQAMDTSLHVAAVFVASWLHPGVPRAFVAVKGIGHLPMELPYIGTMSNTGYAVLNVSRAVTLGSEIMPAEHGSFFGTQSFDAGTGLTIYAKFRCVDASQWLCEVLNEMNPKDAEITVHAFAGVTASEVSLGSEGLGMSMARGVSISATLPVVARDLDPLGLSIDSTQVGLMFAVQDSVVYEEDGKQSNVSIGVAPTMSIWMTGKNGNTWQVDGSLGLEWDPTADQSLRPKLVFSAQLAQVWQLKWVRLGNPQLVFTTPLGPRKEREATEVALSGSWGFGPDNGFGIAEGGGDVRGDAGAAATGGSVGFEEVGRGQVTFSLKRPPSARSTADARKERDDATKAVTAHLHVVNAARAKVNAEKKNVEWAMNTTMEEYEAAQRALKAAELKLLIAEAELDRLRKTRNDARDALEPQECTARIATRCLTWKAQLSIGTGSIIDAIGYIIRMGPE